VSDFGTFVTEPIYCKACVQAFASVLKQDTDRPVYVCDYPVGFVAGRIRRLSPTDVEIELEIELEMDIARAICHPVKVALMVEGWDVREFEFKPWRPSDE